MLLFLYLLYKLGICECVVRSLCKTLWACLVSWLSLWEHCCFFLCDTSTVLRRISHRHRHRRKRDFSSDELDTSEDDCGYELSRTTEMRRSLSREMREHRRVHRLRKSLRPRSHRIRVGFRKESEFGSYGRNYQLHNKHRNHISTVHNIRVIRSSMFARKGMNLIRPKVYSRVRCWKYSILYLSIFKNYLNNYF